MVQQKPSTASPRVVVFDNGMWFDVDPSGFTTLFAANGNELWIIDQNGNIFQKVGGVNFGSGNQSSFNSAGVLSKYNNINTAGQGIAVIRAVSVQNQTNLAPTTLSYTPPAAAGTYRITSYLNASTATTLTFKNILGYTDAAGTAQTDIPVWERQNSATMLVAPTANTADRFIQVPYIFSIDNSATAITLGDNTGTYTTCVYRYTIVLEQLI
jgi:hypothetical protein